MIDDENDDTIEQPEHRPPAPDAMVSDLLTLMADPKDHKQRHRKLMRLERQIADAESALAAARVAKAEREADQAKAAAALAQYRERVEIEEGAVDELEEEIAQGERDWEGISPPRELHEQSSAEVQ
jgi:chromosome segregation ATPase